MAVGIADGKKHFSRLIEEAAKGKGEIVVTKRGKPLAVIISYEEYESAKRLEGYRQIMEAREAFIQKGVKAQKVFKESREQLERKVWKR